MTLELDHIQCLNQHALLGAQRGDVATIRALWALQDQLALSIDEETAIALQRDFAGESERVVWNPARSIALKTFDLSDGQLARLRAAIETWDGYGVASDRRWLEPLLRQITRR